MDQNYQPQSTNPPVPNVSDRVPEIQVTEETPITPTYTTASKHKKVGPIIAVLVIVFILVIAALYLFASRLNDTQAPLDTSQVAATNTVDDTISLETVTPITNTADDPQSLQNDLDAATQGIDSQNF